MTDQAPSPQTIEFARLVKESERSQKDIADYLTRRLGGDFKHYQVSRWASGAVKVPVEIMDAMRELARQPAESPPVVPALEPTSDVVPLFGFANAAGSTLRLNEDQRVGVVPIHPAQRGSRSAFAVEIFGDSLSPMLHHGDIAYAIRGRTPRKGKPCLIEMKSGEALVKLFVDADERTLFLEQLEPKKALSFPWREIAAVHAIVGLGFN